MRTRKWISALLCASMILAVPLPVSAGEFTQENETALESIQEENLDAQENTAEGSVAEQSLETEVTDENSQEEITPESEITESIEPEQEEIVPESEPTEESNPKPEETAPESEATEEESDPEKEETAPESEPTEGSNLEPEETVPESEATEESNPEQEETVSESEVTEESNPEQEETVPESEATEESNLGQEDIEKSASETDTENAEASGEADKEKQEVNEMEARAAVALAIGPRETENNNSQGTADTIYPNQSVNGNISSSSDVDWYRVTLNSNCYISLTLSHSYIDDGNGYWTMNFRNASNSVTYDMTIAGTETSKRSCRIGLPRGTYYIQVSDNWKQSSINYNLRVNYVAVNYWETENNNSLSTADSISTNQSVTGSLPTGGDIDYYRFTLGSNGYISLTLNHQYIDDGNSYWRVRLFRGSDSSLLEEFTYQGNVASQRSCRIGLPKGSYYVEVSDEWKHSDVDYNLRVNYIAASYWETEVNDSFGTADAISPNVSVTGSLMKSNDTDYYKFTTGSNGYISLTLNHAYIDSSSNYWQIRLYRGSDTTLIEEFNYQGNIASQKSCRIGIPKGTYYLQVSDEWSHSDVDYNLRVNYVADKSYETEINNTASTADAITKNVVSRGTLMARDDVDYYTFSLAANCYVNFRLTHGYIDDNSRMFTLTVRNANNAPVLEYSLTGRETGTNQGLVLPAGKYYVSITDANSHSTTPYGLLVQSII